MKQNTTEVSINNKKSLKSLSKSDDTYRKMFDAANDAIILAEAETGTIINANKQAGKLLGLPLNKIVGTHQTLLHPSGQSETLREIFQRHVKAGQGISQELSVVNGSGVKVPVEISYSATKLNGKKVIQGIFRDITGRKNAEQALRDSEEKYSNLFHYSSDSIFIHDAEGNIMDVNQKVLEQFEYTRTEMLPLNMHEIQPDESIESSRECYRKLTQNRAISFETTFRKKNGDLFPADVSASQFSIGIMKVIRSVVRDISDRKQLEEEFLKRREELEKDVRKQTNELVALNKSLEKEIRVRKRAEKKLRDHRKQLQSLASQLSLIEEQEKRRIATELHDCMGQTLALGKIKLGLLHKQVSSPELKNIAKEILQLIEQTIRETRTLTFELSPPILYELGFSQAIKWLIDQFHNKYDIKIALVDDGSEKPFSSNIRFFLFQAVRELMINIVKHAQSDNAEIALKKQKNKLIISVTDYGAGFSGSSSGKSGYGLFNIRERMDHINGKFKISSVPGQGTRVTLEAPLGHD
jgi:PAS domain S-box-containing protein